MFYVLKLISYTHAIHYIVALLTITLYRIEMCHHNLTKPLNAS